MRNLGWKQISFEKPKGYGRNETTDTISNILCGWPSFL